MKNVCYNINVQFKDANKGVFFSAKMPKIRTKPQVKPQEQFTDANLESLVEFAGPNKAKLQMTLVALADKYDENIRRLIERTYESMELASLYNRMRASGVYDRGHGEAKHRKILEVPNIYVMQFLDTVMGALYGPDWLKDNRALNHELVKPWWVVSKL